MILTILPEEHAANASLLDEIFKLRARVITRWGWNVPGMAPDYDKDQFDTEHTVYFADIDDESGQIIGTCRFNPTTKPHLLSEIFPEMCAFDGVPAGPEIWEATRYIIDGHGIEKWQEMRSRSMLALALSEYAHENNITHMSWLTTQALYSNMFKLWPSRPLGLPKYFEEDDNTYIAACSELTREATAVLKQRVAQFPSSPIKIVGKSA